MTLFRTHPVLRCLAGKPHSILMVVAALSAFASLQARAAGASSASGRVNAQSISGPSAQWPKDVTTRHKITIAGKVVGFTATAGYITLRNSQTGKAIVDVAYKAFIRDDQNKRRRPVTFAFNGGPGYASAWLNLGAMGPWRLKMNGRGVFPSASPVLHDNAESWLPFTDLVFIDPPGTGYGRIQDKEATSSLWSVKGDIDAMATTIRRWLEANGRTSSPKYLTGESYGGFRVPKITHVLQVEQGVGINGQILVSPVLDFARRNSRGPLSYVSLLPSMAATANSAKAERDGKPVATRANMAAIEDYARGEFLTDLVKGRSNTPAVKRLVENVTKLTGLKRSVVADRAGRISMSTFIRELYRADGKIASMYDGLVTGLDPDRFSPRNNAEDQMRLGLHAPLVQAMVGLYRDRLKWAYPDGRYQFQNEQAGRKWKWGRRPAEAVSDLASTVALDPGMRVLVVHGLTDLVTPYFATQLILDDMPLIDTKKRVTFKVYQGGHMFYSQAASRKSFRDDARALIEATSKPAD